VATKASSLEHSACAVAPDVAECGAEEEDTAPERRYDVLDDEHHADRQDHRSAPRRAAAGTAIADPPRPGSLRQRLRTTLQLIRSNPTGRIALKGFVAVAGALVVAIGIALIPLPGPGWLLVIAGLGIWAVEFHWARRLLAFTRRNVHAWTEWIKRQTWPVRLAAGAAGLVFVGVVVWLSLKYSLGIDVVADVLRYLATH